MFLIRFCSYCGKPDEEGGSVATIVLNDLCYQYTYDLRQRMIEKTTGG